MESQPDPASRREQIAVTLNPRRATDYLVEFNALLPPVRLTDTRVEGLRLDVRYVPDKVLYDVALRGPYLGALSSELWQGMEDLAANIFDDLNNELVPRWLNLRFGSNDGMVVMFEERQPLWDNPALLARIAPK